MRFREYLEDHILFVLFSIFWVIVESVLLLLLKVEVLFVFILGALWFVFLGSYLVIRYMNKNRRMKAIFLASDGLDKKYLLHEVMPVDGSYEDELYRIILRTSCKSMLGQVTAIERDRKEYQEYVEQWVHEIKTPIVAMRLWCENQNKERKKEAMLQLEKMQHYVEQALFYARSENVEKDFRIRPISLLSCMQESLLACKYLCTSVQMRITLPKVDCEVYSDEKWVIFILNQLIENAVKYRKIDHPAILNLVIQKDNKDVYLVVEDHGCGIQTQDLSKIFEKGFTGENGRNADRHATGIGLYLCKRLCDRMGITIQVESSVNQYTKFILHFTLI